jgi:hypothetical protein
MLDAKLSKIGKLTIENGQMHAIGFDTDKPMMCRELAAHVCVWAIGQLQEELARILAAPSGTMAVDEACEHCGANEVHGLEAEDCATPKLPETVVNIRATYTVPFGRKRYIPPTLEDHLKTISPEFHEEFTRWFIGVQK